MKTLVSRSTHSFLLQNPAFAVLAAILAVILIGSPARAQSGAGSIQGTVTDSTGALIPNASIHVVNQSTNGAADAKTNSVGFSHAPGLFTATYTVPTTLQGIQPH